MTAQVASEVDLPVARSLTVKDTLDSVTALARFEFEPNRGNDGTKVIMVEWQDDNKSRHKCGSWQVSWLGKKTTFAADDNPSDSTNRLYFLLPPGASVPPSITITYTPPTNPVSIPSNNQKLQNSILNDASSKAKDSEKNSMSLHMTVYPLPAIFTPELGATAKASGKKGVLHTIWAKRRLQVLAKEIRSESEFNLEGIALEMAMAEKQWIEQNFGISTPQPKQSTASAGLKLDLGSIDKVASPPLSPGIQNPRSPGGRRLTEKLKGLSITTTENQATGNVNTPIRELNPLSPEASDMAVSSFSAIRGDRTTRSTGPAAPKRIMPMQPPTEVTDQQAMSASASLASIARGDLSARPDSGVLPRHQSSQDGEDLFAVAMSPRSPDAPKSPFSIPSGEEHGVGAFSRIKGVQA